MAQQIKKEPSEALRLAQSILKDAFSTTEPTFDHFRELTKNYGTVIENVELAGLYYLQADAHSKARGLSIGDNVFLQLDHNNAYDKFAVKVYDEEEKGTFLGYIPKEYSKDVHNKIANDTGYVALVSGNDGDTIPHIYLNLYPRKPNEA